MRASLSTTEPVDRGGQVMNVDRFQNAIAGAFWTVDTIFRRLLKCRSFYIFDFVGA